MLKETFLLVWLYWVRRSVCFRGYFLLFASAANRPSIFELMSDERLVVVGTAAVMGAGSCSALAAQAHDRRWVRKPKSTHLLLCWHGTIGQKKMLLGADRRMFMNASTKGEWHHKALLVAALADTEHAESLFPFHSLLPWAVVCCWSVSRPALRWLLLAHHRQQLALLLVCVRPASVLSVSPEWSSKSKIKKSPEWAVG